VILSTLGREHRRPRVVLGDFNDVADAVTTGIVLGIGAPSGDRLYDACQLQRRQDRLRHVGFSNLHEGQYTTIDHILVSGEFNAELPEALGEIVDVVYLNDHLDLGLPEASDHGQVLARLRLFERAGDAAPFGTNPGGPYNRRTAPLDRGIRKHARPGFLTFQRSECTARRIPIAVRHALPYSAAIPSNKKSAAMKIESLPPASIEAAAVLPSAPAAAGARPPSVSPSSRSRARAATHTRMRATPSLPRRRRGKEGTVHELSARDVAVVEARPLAVTLPLSGSLTPLAQATVRSKVSGVVRQTTVQEGMRSPPAR
jgi:hypothetical protein